MTLKITHGIALLFAACLTSCGETEPSAASLAELARNQTAYNGQMVVAEGVLRTHAEPRHYWIEDDSFNRVELVYGEELTWRVGQQLRVRGRFRYEPSRGRRIDVETLTQLPAVNPQPAAPKR